VRFLVENQLPAALAHWLAERGHDAVHVLDRELGQASDRELWSLAIAENRIVISKDEDFLHLASRPADLGSLVWLRLGNCRKQFLLTYFAAIWPKIEAALQIDQRIVEVR
jgi:predicted nuclease of predicted toxin-antitoxin system